MLTWSCKKRGSRIVLWGIQVFAKTDLSEKLMDPLYYIFMLSGSISFNETPPPYTDNLNPLHGHTVK